MDSILCMILIIGLFLISPILAIGVLLGFFISGLVS